MALPVSSTSGGSATAREICTPRDRQLVAECLAGRAAAWDSFIDQFAGLIEFVIDRTAAQRGLRLAQADRDDLLSDAMLELVGRDAAVLRSFRGNSSLATYLVVVVRRLAVRRLTQMAQRNKSTDVAAAGLHLARNDDGQDRIADREQVERMIARLDPQEAELVTLYHLKGMSYGEISSKTGIPVGSIGPMLARARQKMDDRAN